MDLGLIEESVIKNYDGVIDISVTVIKGLFRKSYTFSVRSERDYWDYAKLRTRKPGKALNFLKKANIKQEGETS